MSPLVDYQSEEVMELFAEQDFGELLEDPHVYVIARTAFTAGMNAILQYLPDTWWEDGCEIKGGK